MSKLISTEFQSFLEMFPRHITDTQSFVEACTVAFPLMTGILKTGLFEFTVESELNPSPVVYSVYASSHGIGEGEFIKEFELESTGKVSFDFKPVHGYKFTFDDEKNMEFFAMLLFWNFEKVLISEINYQNSFKDPLTLIGNERALNRFGMMLTQQHMLSYYDMLFCNCMNFKYINQKVTPRVGDVVLKKYAQTIQSFIKDDGIVVRMGGDNFCILIKKERSQEIVEFLKNVSVVVPNVQSGKEDSMDISVWGGLYEIQIEDNLSDALKFSNCALNYSRRNKCNGIVIFSNEMFETQMHQQTVSWEFPVALQKQEFLVYYQPKVNVKTKTLCGCEALVRWERNGNVLPPMKFIPQLESDGSICNLDFFVFNKVCMDIRKWLDMGLSVPRVSANFSRHHLRNRYLAEDILDIIEKNHIDPSYIEIELTEMSGYEDFDALNIFVEKLHQKGILTSFDDFGKGYSSLNMIKNLKVDIIKIDKSFVDSISDAKSNNEVVIRNVVRMIHDLNMEVVAEGVETETQVEYLKAMDCLMVQGFLYDKALPEDEFIERLRQVNY